MNGVWQLSTLQGSTFFSSKIKLRVQWATERKNWTLENCKNIAWFDESRFLLFYADGKTRYGENHKYMHPSCRVSILQAGGVFS
jgi:hypothetical protein